MKDLRKLAIRYRDKLVAKLFPDKEIATVLQNPTIQTCLRTHLVVMFLNDYHLSGSDAARWADRVTGCVNGNATYPAQDVLAVYPKRD